MAKNKACEYKKVYLRLYFLNIDNFEYIEKTEPFTKILSSEKLYTESNNIVSLHTY